MGTLNQIINISIVQSIIWTEMVAMWVNSFSYTAAYRTTNTVQLNHVWVVNEFYRSIWTYWTFFLKSSYVKTRNESNSNKIMWSLHVFFSVVFPLLPVPIHLPLFLFFFSSSLPSLFVTRSFVYQHCSYRSLSLAKCVICCRHVQVVRYDVLDDVNPSYLLYFGCNLHGVSRLSMVISCY